MRKGEILILSIIFVLLAGNCGKKNIGPTTDNGEYFLLNKTDIPTLGRHQQHFDFYSQYVHGYNNYVLKAIDKIQATAPDGGGYFIGITAEPPESPIGYDLAYRNEKLIEAPRTTSYCSGASYSAFIEALNMIAVGQGLAKPDSVHIETIRMQEPDDGRREDHVKLWGKWNADGFGNHFALVQYTKMGKEVKPAEARPGDFANISWQSGLGHSVVFLSWVRDDEGNKYLLYWSSQKSTNGLSDQLVSLDKIKDIKIVRLTNPEEISVFDINNKNINVAIKGDKMEN